MGGPWTSSSSERRPSGRADDDFGVPVGDENGDIESETHPPPSSLAGATQVEATSQMTRGKRRRRHGRRATAQFVSRPAENHDCRALTATTDAVRRRGTQADSACAVDGSTACVAARTSTGKGGDGDRGKKIANSPSASRTACRSVSQVTSRSFDHWGEKGPCSREVGDRRERLAEAVTRDQHSIRARHREKTLMEPTPGCATRHPEPVRTRQRRSRMAESERARRWGLRRYSQGGTEGRGTCVCKVKSSKK